LNSYYNSYHAKVLKKKLKIRNEEEEEQIKVTEMTHMHCINVVLHGTHEETIDFK
jgi:hypothetical protein